MKKLILFALLSVPSVMAMEEGGAVRGKAARERARERIRVMTGEIAEHNHRTETLISMKRLRNEFESSIINENIEKTDPVLWKHVQGQLFLMDWAILTLPKKRKLL